MLKQLKQDVCRANLDLVTEGLVIQTWGNASGIDRALGSWSSNRPACHITA